MIKVLCVCPHICKIHSSVDRRVGRLHVLALVTGNRTAVDMGVKRSYLQFWSHWIGKDELAPLEHHVASVLWNESFIKSHKNARSPLCHLPHGSVPGTDRVS